MRPVWGGALLLSALLGSTSAIAEPVRAGGRLLTREGGALAGCSILATDGSEVLSDDEGRFRIELELPARLTIRCKDHLDQELVLASPSASEIVVRLEPVPSYSQTIAVSSGARVPPETPRARLTPEELEIRGAGTAAQGARLLPGVFAERDRGDEERIFVRGGEPRLVTTTLDGERLPSPDGSERTAGLGMLPLGAVAGVEVRRTFSPDLEGDAIAGAVDVLTPLGGGEPFLRAAFAPTYGDLRERVGGRADLSLARVSGAGRTRLYLAAAASRDEDELQRAETRSSAGRATRDELSNQVFERDRRALFLRFENGFGKRHRLAVKALASDYDRREETPRVNLDYAGGEVERELQLGTRARSLRLASILGDAELDGRTTLAYQIGYQGAGERDHDRLDASFVSPEPPDSALGLDSPGASDADLFQLDQIGIEDGEAHEDNLVASLDATTSAEAPVTRWKTGFKLRRKDKRQDRTAVLLRPDTELTLAEIADLGGSPVRLFDGSLDLGPLPSTDGVRHILAALALTPTPSLEPAAADYDALENTVASYALADLAAGRSTLRAGLRWEATSSEYRGVEVQEGADGEGSTAVRQGGEKGYDVWLPMVEITTELAASLRLTAAVTRSFARPDYFDLAPFANIDLEDREIARGNPDLEASRAWNFDLGTEWSPAHRPRSRIGLFRKHIEGFIYPRRFSEDLGGRVFDVTQPANGNNATLSGLELGLRHDFSGGPARGLGIDLQALWTRSDAGLTERPATSTPLPGQADRSGSLTLLFRRGPFSARWVTIWRSAYLWQLGETAADDLFFDSSSEHDLGLGLTLSRRWQIDLTVRNLTGAEDRIYQGAPDRTFRRDVFGRALRLRACIEL